MGQPARPGQPGEMEQPGQAGQSAQRETPGRPGHPGRPDGARLATGLREQTAVLAEAVRDADPALPVPTCPEWTLTDLVAHVGRAHRWAATLVERRAAEPLPFEAVPDREPPVETGRWPDWLCEGAEALLAAVRDAGPGVAVWTFTGPAHPGFWVRRMLHDTAVHTADAALTTGRAYGIPADLAADGVDEALGFASEPWALAAKPELAELRGHGERMLLSARDVAPDGGWLITRTPDGVVWERGGGEADVVLRGTAEQVLLVLTRRLPADDPRLEVTGRTALLEYWLERTAFQ
ncbi:maleylpyruvate isomerase family mycothiol-dependent enzyme [Allostreptomyces psammosilenae]|uniref:Uncharacterized protein (TIGR03083 family) n=1 Tax=Allostreptomyces psammosilenae TaxID=1892865 RepID=A0A853A1T5_9ACTN|nr:maleylpyruvate isomerase family mycothiol-dependent enzyme [Allostreptomyces psammosilenae]NYI08339.1 uncharacterized protein (TIGR03083 family) [Allostreptomyces psammosilenae]